jgi:uncharacterized membrane protein YkvI
MISLNEQQKKLFLWIGVIMLLFGGILAILQGSSPITAIIAIIGFILILVWKFA